MEWLERQLVFFPDKTLVYAPDRLRLAYEDIWVKTKDGCRIHGWFLPAAEEQARMLFIHGNGGNISHRLYHAPVFTRRGISMLLMDYRGYGQSEGVPSEEGIYEDGRAMLAFLQKKKPAGSRLVYYGESLGSAVAVELAAHASAPDRLIIEGGFSSARDMAIHMYSVFGKTLPLSYKFDSMYKMERVKAPLLSIHGSEDDVVPLKLGQKLFAAHPGPQKDFFPVDGAHHNDLVMVAGSAFYDRISSFIFG